jgi:hypothetical protein
MGRVLFPTRNDIGVRTLLGGTLGSDYAGFRAPAEPAPRGASNPVMLGAAASTGSDIMRPAPPVFWGAEPIVYRPPLLPARPQPVGPIVAQPFPTPIVVSTPVAARPSPPAPPVSQQTTPTPVVYVPPAQPAAPLVTSGGGTVAPNIAPAAPVPAPITYTTDAAGNIINAQTGTVVVAAAQASASGTTAASLNAAEAAPAASSGITDQIAAWLAGNTAIGTWSVPNALLAGAIILGFAFLEGGGSSSSSVGRKR